MSETNETRGPVIWHQIETLHGQSVLIGITFDRTQRTMNTLIHAKRYPEPEVMGPYSEWPRQPKKVWKKPSMFAGTIIVAGIYLHCGLPLLV